MEIEVGTTIFKHVCRVFIQGNSAGTILWRQVKLDFLQSPENRQSQLPKLHGESHFYV